MRQNARLYLACSTVLGTDDILVNHDRFGLFRPTKDVSAASAAAVVAEAAGAKDSDVGDAAAEADGAAVSEVKDAGQWKAPLRCVYLGIARR